MTEEQKTQSSGTKSQSKLIFKPQDKKRLLKGIENGTYVVRERTKPDQSKYGIWHLFRIIYKKIDENKYELVYGYAFCPDHKAIYKCKDAVSAMERHVEKKHPEEWKKLKQKYSDGQVSKKNVDVCWDSIPTKLKGQFTNILSEAVCIDKCSYSLLFGTGHVKLFQLCTKIGSVYGNGDITRLLCTRQTLAENVKQKHKYYSKWLGDTIMKPKLKIKEITIVPDDGKNT